MAWGHRQSLCVINFVRVAAIDWGPASVERSLHPLHHPVSSTPFLLRWPQNSPPLRNTTTAPRIQTNAINDAFVQAREDIADAR